MKQAVIIPLYNKAPYVAHTLASLAAQSKKPDELIVVDDASTDNSLTVVKETLTRHAHAFANTRIEIIPRSHNGGPGHARNTGLEHSTAGLISFLDADDAYHPDCLKTVHTCMTENKVDFLVLGILTKPGQTYYPDIQALGKGVEPVSENLFLLPKPLHTVTSPHFIMGMGSNVVVKRQWIGNCRYEQNSLLNEGIDFWYRVLKNTTAHPGNRVGLLHGNYIEVREVEGSLSRKKYTRWKELEIPPSILRYRKSRNLYDRQLVGMLGQRWFEHAMYALPDKKQKLLFMLNHFPALVQQFGYRLTRRLIPHDH